MPQIYRPYRSSLRAKIVIAVFALAITGLASGIADVRRNGGGVSSVMLLP